MFKHFEQRATQRTLAHQQYRNLNQCSALRLILTHFRPVRFCIARLLKSRGLADVTLPRLPSFLALTCDGMLTTLPRRAYVLKSTLAITGEAECLLALFNGASTGFV